MSSSLSNFSFSGLRIRIIITSVLGIVMVPSNIFASHSFFSPGEVLVKFRDASDESQVVKEATRTDDRHRINLIVQTLETKAGWPLVLKQLLSNDQILLTVDCQKLVNQVTARLRETSEIARVAIDNSQPHECRNLRSMSVQLSFIPGSMREQISTKAPQNSPELQKLISELEEHVHAPLEVVSNKEVLVLKIDIAKLTMRLAEQLKTIDALESAQLNYIMSFR